MSPTRLSPQGNEVCTVRKPGCLSRPSVEQGRIKPLRPALARLGQGSFLISDGFAAVSASQHPPSLVISWRPVRRPERVSGHGLPAILLSRGRQWRSAINIHSEDGEEALRRISRDGTVNIGAAHRGVSKRRAPSCATNTARLPASELHRGKRDGSTASVSRTFYPGTTPTVPERPEGALNVRLVVLAHCCWYCSWSIEAGRQQKIMDVEKEARDEHSVEARNLP